MTRPRILLTNDDGVASPGLLGAYAELSEVAEVTVVAPVDQRSGHAHMITLETPLRAHRLTDLPGWKVDYTPVDCVKLALRNLLPEPPDLVVSGINWGWNAGNLVHYSGTVGAAVEAALNGVPALAVSLCSYSRQPDFGPAARVTRLLAERWAELAVPRDCILNVNVPDKPLSELKGFRWARQSLQTLDDHYDERRDPRHRTYYWLTGSVSDMQGLVPDDDLSVLAEGYVALTPLSLDWTHGDTLRQGRERGVAGLDRALRA